MSTEMRVGAGDVARVYEMVAGRPRTVALEHTGTRSPVNGRELALVIDGATVSEDDLEPDGEPRLDPARAGLRWRLSSPGRDLAVTVVVTGDPEEGVVRKRLEITGRGRLRSAELDRWVGSGARGFPDVSPTGRGNAGAPGLGQPLFGDGYFCGVEHPGAANLAGNEASSCVLPVAADLGPDPFVTAPAVVGGAPAGRERDGFWDYLDRIRARPPRVVALANNWYQLGWPDRMDERSVTAELQEFAALAGEHGLDLDAYCLDDAWEGRWAPPTGIWGRLDPSRFPDGLPALQRAAGPTGGIGLWVGPFGGYGARGGARVRWGGTQGFEIDPGTDVEGSSNGWGVRLCPGGVRYGAHLAAALGGWTDAGVRYWKLDGVQFDCQGPGHGHATGPGGHTDQMDRFATVLDQIGPDAAVAFTSGSNPSPWWLRHADFLWRGGVDDTAVELAGPRLARFATYIDDCLDEYRDTAVPVSALVTFSVVENDAVSYRDGGRSSDDWRRHCWWMVGRGTLHHDLYCAPGSLSGPEWAAVADALRWARRNQHVLARSRMVGGSPLAGEIYGFAARRGPEAVVALRNPAPSPQAIGFTLGELAGVDPGGGPMVATTVWSDAGGLPPSLEVDQRVDLRLPAFGIVLLSAAPTGSVDG